MRFYDYIKAERASDECDECHAAAGVYVHTADGEVPETDILEGWAYCRPCIARRVTIKNARREARLAGNPELWQEHLTGAGRKLLGLGR